MTKPTNHNGKTAYTCTACNFNYETEQLAKQCEDYCNKHHACSTEITQHALKD